VSEPTPAPSPDGGQTKDDATGLPRPGEVRVEAFQGPLDVLLHLIRTEEIDITTLPLAEIARQYNEALALTRGVEPGLAGDHVVSVATLIHLKSRRLLPPDPTAPEPAVSPEEQALFDRAERIQALRHVAEHLQEREAVMEMVYLRPRASIAEFTDEEAIDADLLTLLRAFREILRRVGNDEMAHLNRERMTLVERIDWLLTTLRREGRVQFRSLFSGLLDRVACILTFLALLEVIRLRLVRAHTSHHHEDILIVLADEPPAAPEAATEHV
jgi:segregation and condensation protein A